MNRNTTHYEFTRRWNAESKRAATRHGQMWTADEIEFIREHLGTITAREMAKHLGRSLHAVNVMRRDLRQGARRAVSPPGERREQRIVEIIADLDNLGVPRDTGRHAASRILKEAGLNATNIDAIGDAVRRRKGNPIRTRDGVSLGGVDELIDILDLLGLPDIAGRPSASRMLRTYGFRAGDTYKIDAAVRRRQQRQPAYDRSVRLVARTCCDCDRLLMRDAYVVTQKHREVLNSRCRSCRYARNLKAMRLRQQRSIPDADRYYYQWTGPELELLATTRHLTLEEMARHLGRTYYATYAMKQRLSRELPREVYMAGTSRRSTDE